MLRVSRRVCGLSWRSFSSFRYADKGAAPDGVTLVRDETTAKRVLEQLMSLRGTKEQPVYHACDTETMDIDVKLQSPMGNGFVTCASIYVGPEHDFGNGPNIWIDNLPKEQGNLHYFKDYFENKDIMKVWHNISFDRHVLYNHGIDVQGFGADTMHMARLWRNGDLLQFSLAALTEQLLPHCPKTSMKDIFSKPKLLMNGLPSKSMKKMAPIEELQEDPETRGKFIEYACLDARATWELRQELEKELKEMKWVKDKSMYEFYEEWYRPFGELLTDMERVGVHINQAPIAEMVRQAQADKEKEEQKFLSWASRYCEDAKYMKIRSARQRAALFFGKKGKKTDFEVENTIGFIKEGSTRPTLMRTISLTGLGMKPVVVTKGGAASFDQVVLKKLIGTVTPDGIHVNSLVKNHFKNEEEGEAAARAVESLKRVAHIAQMLSTFIKPLSTGVNPATGRMHCSLNINTETGRLSARRPNLQNQPNVASDVYKVRDVFAAPKGSKLIVADYGQLELRILSEMTKCKSMIEAFRLGGDFHSRTAMGMFSYIKEAVDEGSVLMEWDWSKGEPDKPLLKDKFSEERGKGKMLNFSIAYGKTAFGLAKDWGETTQEAQKTIDLWYSDRPEVLKWQEQKKKTSTKEGFTRTMMGRYRWFPNHNTKDKWRASSIHRAAINTPVQGGAADVVMAAMVKLHQHERFREMKWRMILQVHDEIISEGPEEHAEEAMAIIMDCMQHPLQNPTTVALTVDAKCADTWYQAK